MRTYEDKEDLLITDIKQRVGGFYILCVIFYLVSKVQY